MLLGVSSSGCADADEKKTIFRPARETVAPQKKGSLKDKTQKPKPEAFQPRTTVPVSLEL